MLNYSYQSSFSVLGSWRLSGLFFCYSGALSYVRRSYNSIGLKSLGRDPKWGAAGSVIDVLTENFSSLCGNRRGILEDKCGEILKNISS